MNYRDRAKERRDKYGIDDTPEFSKRKFEMEKQSLPPLKEKTPPPISDDNIGNRMLKAMGWVRFFFCYHQNSNENLNYFFF